MPYKFQFFLECKAWTRAKPRELTSVSDLLGPAHNAAVCTTFPISILLKPSFLCASSAGLGRSARRGLGEVKGAYFGR